MASGLDGSLNLDRYWVYSDLDWVKYGLKKVWNREDLSFFWSYRPMYLLINYRFSP